MNNFGEAVRRYSRLAKQYQGQVAELIAGQRLWLCCNALLRQPQELRPAVDATRIWIRSARATLAKLADSQFQGPPGTWTRADWQRFFDGVDAQLPQLSVNLAPPTPPSKN
jgi:hypothetical protein